VVAGYYDYYYYYHYHYYYYILFLIRVHLLSVTEGELVEGVGTHPEVAPGLCAGTARAFRVVTTIRTASTMTAATSTPTLIQCYRSSSSCFFFCL